MWGFAIGCLFEFRVELNVEWDICFTDQFSERESRYVVEL